MVTFRAASLVACVTAVVVTVTLVTQRHALAVPAAEFVAAASLAVALVAVVEAVEVAVADVRGRDAVAVAASELFGVAPFYYRPAELAGCGNSGECSHSQNPPPEGHS